MVDGLVPVYLRVFVDGIMVTQFIKGRGLKRVHICVDRVSAAANTHGRRQGGNLKVCKG